MSLYTSSATTPTSMPTASSSTAPVTFNPASSSSAGTGRNGESKQSPLRSITSKSGFVYPPIWSFPPFFTSVPVLPHGNSLPWSPEREREDRADGSRLQPNPSTLSHQLGLWTNLVLNWARHERIWEINVDTPDPPEVFMNRTINRMSPLIS